MLAGLLNCTCTIQRRRPSGTNAVGQPTFDWRDTYVGVKCGFRDTPETERDDRFSVAVKLHRLYFTRNIDVTEADRIREIKRGESVLEAGVFQVVAVSDPQALGRLLQVDIERADG